MLWHCAVSFQCFSELWGEPCCHCGQDTRAVTRFLFTNAGANACMDAVTKYCIFPILLWHMESWQHSCCFTSLVCSLAAARLDGSCSLSASSLWLFTAYSLEAGGVIFKLLHKRQQLNCDLLCQMFFQIQFINALYVSLSWEVPATLTVATLSSRKPTKTQLWYVVGAQMPLHVRYYHENHIIRAIRGLWASDVANCLHFLLVCNLSLVWPTLLKCALCGQRRS